MNELNYASLEASKRLRDAGIVLKTEVGWYEDSSLGWCLYRVDSCYGKYTPAAQFAEVWRELPFQAYVKKMDDGTSMVWVYDDGNCESDFITNHNPTDALIDLLIWVRKEAK